MKKKFVHQVGNIKKVIIRCTANQISTINLGRVWAVPRLCEFHPGVCLTTEEKARGKLS